MIITKNFSSDKITLDLLEPGEFFEFEGELYLIVKAALTYYTCFNFSKEKNYNLSDEIEVYVIDKHKIEITYSL